ncbi:21003_t:CDS:2, partial [Gigaspora margarita]
IPSYNNKFKNINATQKWQNINNANNEAVMPNIVETGRLHNQSNQFIATYKEKRKKVISKVHHRSEQSEQQIILPKIRPDKFAKRLQSIVIYKEKQRSVSKAHHRLERPEQQIILPEIHPD